MGLLQWQEVPFFCKESRRWKPTIVGHFLSAYIYSAFVSIAERLSVPYIKIVVSYCLEISQTIHIARYSIRTGCTAFTARQNRQWRERDLAF